MGEITVVIHMTKSVPFLPMVSMPKIVRSGPGARFGIETSKVFPLAVKLCSSFSLGIAGEAQLITTPTPINSVYTENNNKNINTSAKRRDFFFNRT